MTVLQSLCPIYLSQNCNNFQGYYLTPNHYFEIQFSAQLPTVLVYQAYHKLVCIAAEEGK